MSNETVSNEDKVYKVRVSDEGTLSVDDVTIKSSFGPVAHDDDENYTIQGQRRVEFYMQTIAEMLYTTIGFTAEEFAQRYAERLSNDDWVEGIWHSGAVKYWEKGILFDFVNHLEEGEHEEEHWIVAPSNEEGEQG